jgi:chemotaxis signal transduction protein
VRGEGDATFREVSEEELRRFWDAMVERYERENRLEQGHPHVIFRVGASRFALDAAACRGVTPYRTPTPLPSLPRHLIGVVAVRGRPISVTDLRVLLGVTGERAERRGHILLLAKGALETALKVDWAEGVRPIDPGDVREADTTLVRGARSGLVTGTLLMRGQPVHLLDVERCLGQATV